MVAVSSLQGEAEKLEQVIDRNVDTEKLERKFDFSNFDINAVLRGMQLTLVGGK